MNGLRLAVFQDLPAIMDIVEDAQAFLKTQDSGQWQDGTPNISTIAEDSLHNRFFVWEEEGTIIGITALLDYDKDYDHLTSGHWRFSGSYLVIHRFAVLSQYHSQGIASKMLKAVEEIAKERKAKSIRVDTHKKNAPMIALLTKNGFVECGEVMIDSTKPRITFDKEI